MGKICAYLQTAIDKLPPITFQVFDTRQAKQEADPHHSISRASARFEQMAVFRFWQPDDDAHYPHEITHLVAHRWATPYNFNTQLDTWDDKIINKKVAMVSTSFMQEGLAIAVDEIVFGRKLLEENEYNWPDDWCREQKETMPKKLCGVINLDGFSKVPNKIVVPFCASLVKFLLINFGLDKFKQMYILLREIDSPEKNVTRIQSIYKIPETKLIKLWRQSLNL